MFKCLMPGLTPCVSQNQPVALLEFAVHLSVYGKVYSRPSAIVAYTNSGYLRDA
jgi:hypothetical protein